MTDGPKRTLSDTQPIVISPEVLERFRRESERPSANADDVRRALADTVPDAVSCPGCGGFGRTSAARAAILEDAIAATQAVLTCPVRHPGAPAVEGDEDPTQVD